MAFRRIALSLAGLLTFAGCGTGEQVTVSFYGEGTGDGDLRVTNDEGQAMFGGMDANSTAEGELAAGSRMEIRAVAHAGSHFVGFGGDCSGTSSPFVTQLSGPKTCSVRFDKD
jgi:hypothetical protein